jgi:carbon-monoxide dehydrogenase large subunit
VLTAAEMVLEKGHALASEALEAAAADIVYEGGEFRIAGTDRVIGLDELARRFPGRLDSTAELPSPICQTLLSASDRLHVYLLAGSSWTTSLTCCSLSGAAMNLNVTPSLISESSPTI